MGLLAFVIIGSSVFFACKKERIGSNDIVTNGSTKAISTGDTIYIPTNLAIYCDDCNECYGTGGNCLPEVIVRPKNVGIDIIRNVFTELINAENNTNANEIKRNIVAANVNIFLQFISEEWIDRIINETGFISVINHNVYDKYILSLRFINGEGENTYFMTGDGTLIFDALYQTVVLMDGNDE